MEERYDTPQLVRLALSRMDLTPTQLAALLRYWGDYRPRATIYRGVAKFASRKRDLPTPWMLRALLTMMERAPAVWQTDLPHAVEAWQLAERIEEQQRQQKGTSSMTDCAISHK